ncbi:MAG: hypothetical protein AB8A49_01240, partial [Prochlorococcus sp.]
MGEAHLIADVSIATRKSDNLFSDDDFFKSLSICGNNRHSCEDPNETLPAIAGGTCCLGLDG